MTRRKKCVLRPLSEHERASLKQMARSQHASAVHVRRAHILLAVADGQGYLQACQAQGYADGDPAARLVARFNSDGLAALTPRHAGGPPIRYGAPERTRILNTVRQAPDAILHAILHGTKTWSLTTLRRHLRQEAFPEVSTYTIWKTLTESGLHFQQSRTWCETGTARRVRKSGVVNVVDPDAEAKKT